METASCRAESGPRAEGPAVRQAQGNALRNGENRLPVATRSQRGRLNAERPAGRSRPARAGRNSRSSNGMSHALRVVRTADFSLTAPRFPARRCVKPGRALFTSAAPTAIRRWPYERTQIPTWDRAARTASPRRRPLTTLAVSLRSSRGMCSKPTHPYLSGATAIRGPR